MLHAIGTVSVYGYDLREFFQSVNALFAPQHILAIRLFPAPLFNWDKPYAILGQLVQST